MQVFRRISQDIPVADLHFTKSFIFLISDHKQSRQRRKDNWLFAKGEKKKKNVGGGGGGRRGRVEKKGISNAKRISVARKTKDGRLCTVVLFC